MFDHIYGWLRQLPTEDELRQVVRDLATRHRVDMAAFCADLCMGWDELATLAADPLVTIGAHTVNHPILTKLDDKAVRAEMEQQPRRDRGGARRRGRRIWPIRSATARRPARANSGSRRSSASRPR